MSAGSSCISKYNGKGKKSSMYNKYNNYNKYNKARANATCYVEINALKRTGTVWPNGLIVRAALPRIQVSKSHGNRYQKCISYS